MITIKRKLLIYDKGRIIRNKRLKSLMLREYKYIVLKYQRSKKSLKGNIMMVKNNYYWF